MNFAGVTDSQATLFVPTQECPSCHTASRIAQGLCLSCLLQTAVGATETDPAEFEAILKSVAVPDTSWRLGNYEILEEIGRGGMGVIYRARQRHSRRIVALKRILSFHSDSRETLARFGREAEAAASLDHPNILPIYEVSQSEEGIPYFSMKFAPGGSLREIGPALRDDPREAARLMAKVTRAVQYAHRQGILHRDLTPANILLDGRREPLVSDFGLAKWLDASTDLTRTLTIYGTPGFIAPEQANGPSANLKPSTDVYSLGAILFTLLGGQPPFLGEHALAVIRQASEQPAPKLRSLVPEVDRDLETICSRCLETEPGARYQTAGDLAEDLERWLEGRPILARPVSLWGRAWRWGKRNRVLASSFLLTLGVGGWALGRQYESARLAQAIRNDQVAAHSVGVIPFLNLDDMHPESELATQVADALRIGLASIGPSAVQTLPEPPRDWTGAGTQDEVTEAAQQTRSRAILTGTVRKTGNTTRLSLHLLKGTGTEVLKHWLFEIPAGQTLGDTIGRIATTIYPLVPGAAGAESTPDPTMENAEARAYFLAGRSLIDRRTVADMDRAIGCFEGAIRAEPRSIVARTYLAMACMGRNFLLPKAGLVERAFQVAQEAGKMAPEDPSTNRGLCFLYTATNADRKALEYGLRALEFGDGTERAFGQIGNIWRSLGRPDKAILWFEKAKISKRQPADYEAFLGDCWTDLGMDARAEKSYEAAMNFRPDLAEGWVGLCRLKLLQGNLEGARALCQSQMANYAATPLSNINQARVEFFARNFMVAERLYRELQALDPNGGPVADAYADIDLYSVLARLEKEAHHDDAAEALCQKSIAEGNERLAKAPKDAAGLYRLAAAEAVAARPDDAIGHLGAAIKAGWVDPRSPRVDPRFDSLGADPRFKELLADLAVRATALGRAASPPEQRSYQGAK